MNNVFDLVAQYLIIWIFDLHFYRFILYFKFSITKYWVQINHDKSLRVKVLVWVFKLLKYDSAFQNFWSWFNQILARTGSINSARKTKKASSNVRGFKKKITIYDTYKLRNFIFWTRQIRYSAKMLLTSTYF